MRILSRKFSFALVLALVASCFAAAGSKTPKGNLFIIGGGERTNELMQRFIQLAGGVEKAKIVVIPMASSIPDTVGMEQVEEMKSLGVRDAKVLMLTREQALEIQTTERLDGVTGIFFSGGDQSRLTAIMNGTPLLEKVKSLYREGAVIGGTSAGAAIMSRVMITGAEKVNKDSNNAFVFIKPNNIVTTEGFGFIDDVIVDQHFIRRKRHNRLLSLVLEHPKLLGIGIDEATAIIVKPNRTFEVAGENTVIIFDASAAQNIHTDAKGNLATRNIRTHILSAGEQFDLNTRRVISPKRTR